MKDIGEILKEKRESMEISIEEVALDLKLRPSQIENIEAGNMDAFKDVFYLKYFIRDYAKYLGLKHEDLVDDFNEYLFDYTSKISLDDIKKAKRKLEQDKKTETKKIASPYTIEQNRHFKLSPVVIYIIILFILVLVAYFVFSHLRDDSFVDGTVITEEDK